MPDFVKDAFERAISQCCEDEGKAFEKVMDERGQTLMLTACHVAGYENMAKIFETITKMGLQNAMHVYELNLMMLAFHEGMNAPRMEDMS